MMNYLKYSLVLTCIISCLCLNGAQELAIAGVVFAAKKVIAPPLDEVGIGFKQMVKDVFARQKPVDQHALIQADLQREQDDERERLEIELERKISSPGQLMIRMLHKAVRTQNQEKVAALLNQGVVADTRDEKGRTLLMIASMRGFTSIMFHLIRHDADVDAQDAQKESSLIYAARFNRDGAIRILMNYHAHITRDHQGRLPSSLTTSVAIKDFLRPYEECYRLAHRHDHDRADHEEEHYHERRHARRYNPIEYHGRVRREHSQEDAEDRR
jgi:Ankyrin repeat.